MEEIAGVCASYFLQSGPQVQIERVSVTDGGERRVQGPNDGDETPSARVFLADRPGEAQRTATALSAKAP